MKYFSEDNEFVNAECEVCNKVLKIRKTYCRLSSDKVELNQPIKCFCGNISNEIIVENKRQNISMSNKSTNASTVICPKCRSNQITAQKQGFGLGKAAVGGILTGGIGLLAGFIGSRKIYITCLNCGHKWNP